MIKIISAPENTTHITKCKKCGCKFSLEFKDLETSIIWCYGKMIHCPNCEELILMTWRQIRKSVVKK